jgi:hypothetical protein
VLPRPVCNRHLSCTGGRWTHGLGIRMWAIMAGEPDIGHDHWRDAARGGWSSETREISPCLSILCLLMPWESCVCLPLVRILGWFLQQDPSQDRDWGELDWAGLVGRRSGVVVVEMQFVESCSLDDGMPRITKEFVKISDPTRDRSRAFAGS